MISTINVNGHRMVYATGEDAKPVKNRFGYALESGKLSQLEKDRYSSGGAYDEWFEESGQVIRTPTPILELPNHFYGWWLFRKLTGFDLTNIAQKIGDCVSWGARNATAYRIAWEIITLLEDEFFYDPFAPWSYGGGRVVIGKGRLGNSDGSLGEWSAKFARIYGWIHSMMNGVPAYSGSVAKKWGRKPGPPKDLFSIAKPHLIETVPVRDWESAVDHLARGEMISIASSQGFAMRPGRDMYHRAKGTWMHQMTLTGYCIEPGYECGAIRNSWGDAHGRITDPYTGESWPVGYIRARPEVVDRMLKQGDSYAWLNMHGYGGAQVFNPNLFADVEEMGIAMDGPMPLTLVS